MNSVIPTCKNCFYCKGATQQGQISLVCAFSPPEVVVVPAPNGVQILPVQPPLPATQWCGSWREEASRLVS